MGRREGKRVHTRSNNKCNDHCLPLGSRSSSLVPVFSCHRTAVSARTVLSHTLQPSYSVVQQQEHSAKRRETGDHDPPAVTTTNNGTWCEYQFFSE